MASSSTTSTSPYLDYLQAQPRWTDKPRWFPGMGTRPLPPRNSNFDGYLAKRRDHS